MSFTMSRRTFTAGAMTTALGGTAFLISPAMRGALAGQASDGLADLDLPALDITVTATGFENAPTEIEAGRYLVNVMLGEGVEFGSAAFVSPPDDISVEAFLAIMGGGEAPPDASPVAEGGPEEGGPMGAPPAFVYQARYAGGAVGIPGADGQAVVDLGPGEWILWGDDPTATQEPVIFTVTGDMPEDLPEPASDIDVRFIDFGIMMEGALTAGDHVFRIDNQGAQPHFLFLAKGPDTMTNEQIAEVLEAEMMGMATPEALPFNPDTDLMPVLGTSTQSIDTVIWVQATLEAGTYAGLCFFPTAGTGMPHAFEGMHTVITVS